MQIEFESDYQKKVLAVTFTEATVLQSGEDVRAVREKWLAALKTWHTPYKALVDCGKLYVEASPEVERGLKTLHSFLEKLFLKKAVGFGYSKDLGHDLLPFSVRETRDEAADEVGLGRRAPATHRDDFRAQLRFENHFKTKTIELSFEEDVLVDDKEKIQILKSKLTNNLMHWHSGWNLLIDCSKLTMTSSIEAEWQGFQRFFRGFFLGQTLGYQPRAADAWYPFPCLRSRHLALTRLSETGGDSAEDANCASRKG